MRFGWALVGVTLCAIGLGAWLLRSTGADGGSGATAGPLLQDAYVWQRAWTPSVRDAVNGEAQNLRGFVFLAAEVSFQTGEARLVEVDPDYGGLDGSIRRVGVAIRIGPLPAGGAAAMGTGSKETLLICDAAAKAVAGVRRGGLAVAEVQIDFDCAESKLAGYVNWVRAVRKAVAPVPVVITALPSWLKHAEFALLAKEAGSYVLQVHSLHRPAGPDAPMDPCDPDEARQAVEKASRIGVPFRVALPTYSYLAGFSTDGKLLGLSAEGPAPSWPAGTVLRVMRSDPVGLAGLVRGWTARRPGEMTGVIWYRLPVQGDTMNWRAQTLHAVMAGRDPHPDLRSEATSTQPGLMDVYLVNAGDADGSLRCKVTLGWNGAQLVAAEGIGGFERLDAPDGGVTFQAAKLPVGRWIAPGERVQIGWLRLSADTEVRTHVSSLASE